jgi:adenylate kinase family enzyme
MKIHIFGASGSGVTTLGLALADELGYTYFDTDQYFWEQSGQPFTVKVKPEIRNTKLLEDLSNSENWILGGSIVQWELPQLYNLAVFLYLPPEVRIERLKQREYQRYGDVIFTDPERNKKYNDFIDWASGYDDNTTKGSDGRPMGRTLLVHQNWISNLTCTFLEIAGDTTVAQRIQKIVTVLKTLC